MQIQVRGLKKNFKVPQRKTGAKAAVSQFFKPQYQTVEAIKDISFDIQKGDLIGYLGPNGAGKSTTIKMLTGILVPDAGTVNIDGLVPWQSRKAYTAKIGVVFGQKTQLWWDLPLSDSFALLKAIYKIPDGLYQQQFDWLISGLGIDTYIHQPVRQLSLGQRMRAELVASLLHLPEILFLDEPTIGLDATSKQTVRRFIQMLNQTYGTTVILTTHDMDDIEALCNRVMVIDHGLLAFDGSLPDLRRRVHNMRRMTVDFETKDGCQLLSQLDFNHDHILPISCKDQQLIVEYNPNQIGAQEVINRLSQQLLIKDLLIENPPIEEIIARLYGEWS